MVKKVWKKLLDIIFPKHCVGCRTAGVFLCPKCAGQIPSCEPITAKWIISLWSYKDPRVKKLLWKFKFENKFSAVEDIAIYASDHLSAELSDLFMFDNFKNITLVPVPLSEKSMRRRGYNQSALLAKELAVRLDPEYQTQNLLIKTRETETQHSIKNRRLRLQNLREAYSVRDISEVAGKNILLIDDITTTHATLIEARRALKDAGAKRVLAFTVAH